LKITLRPKSKPTIFLVLCWSAISNLLHNMTWLFRCAIIFSLFSLICIKQLGLRFMALLTGTSIIILELVVMVMVCLHHTCSSPKVTCWQVGTSIQNVEGGYEIQNMVIFYCFYFQVVWFFLMSKQIIMTVGLYEDCVPHEPFTFITSNTPSVRKFLLWF
jgi:hypothetical protein